MAHLHDEARRFTARSLPSVDAVLSTPRAQGLAARYPHALIADAIRAVLETERDRLRSAAKKPSEESSPENVADEAARWIEKRIAADLPRVVNATGVVLHTNLGRAPLAPRAIEALHRAASEPCALEIDLETGERGRRDERIEESLRALTGAESALVVNNNAAALLLIADTLATRREVIVSRGELIEIGGSFRLPEVLARAGAILREVGTTNRTRIEDYEAAIRRRTAILLRAHPSNYRIDGFTEQPSRAELVHLGRTRGIPVVEDLGSGALVDLAQLGLPHEPMPSEAIAVGVDLVSFSGDKLLGGPQAGIVVGRRDLIEKLQANPLKRALRVDKLVLAALHATLSLYRTSLDPGRDVPTLRLLSRTAAELEDLAKNASSVLRGALPSDFRLEIVPSEGQVGSGAQPTLALPSRAIAVSREGWAPQRIAALFRRASPSILGRIAQGSFLLDLRAVHAADDLVPRGIDVSSA